MDPGQGQIPLIRVELRRAPLVLAAAALIAGILGGYYLPLPLGLWAVAGVAAAVAVAGALLRPHLHAPAVATMLAAVAVFGAVAVQIDTFAVSADDILTYTGPHDVLGTVRGRIVTSPAVFEDDPPPAYGYRRPPQTSFLLQASEIRSGAGWLPVRGRVAVTIHEADDRVAAGGDVEVMGWLGRVRGIDNPGQYDWAAAARRRGTVVRLVAPGVESVSILAAGRQSWLAQAYWHIRAAARDHLVACGDERAGQLLNAMLIGERLPALRALNRAMMRAGVVHYLSISGTHLAVFLGFVYLLCRVLALSPRRAAVAVLAVLAAYMLLAEARAPLVRSAIMAAALCLATLTGRRTAALNALAAASIVILAVVPMDLFDPGFQLSFGIVAGILVFTAPVKQAIFGRFLRERGLMVFRERDRLRRWLNFSAANWLMDAVAFSVIAYLVSAPLVAYHFHLFSPYAAPLSLLLAPVVAAVLVPGYVSMALLWPMPNLAYAVGRIASAAADGLTAIMSTVDRVPGLCFQMRDVGVGWVVLCYVAVAVVLAARRTRVGHATVAAAVIVLAAATAYTQRTSPLPGVAELNVLDVGNGQCVVLRTPSGATVLLDAGTRSGFDAYSQVLGPFLRDRRLPGPTTAFISHANTDHFNAMAEVVRHHRLRRVYVNEQFGAETLSDGASMLGAFLAAGVRVERLTAGQRVTLDERTSVEVLWPPVGRQGLTPNESSLVLRITCDQTSVLVTGDIDTVAQSALSAAAGGVRADVLMLPHHGSWRPSVEAFVDAVAPKVIVVSTAREPFGPAAQEEPAKFFSHLRTAYRFYSTPRNGCVQVRFGRGTLDVHTMH